MSDERIIVEQVVAEAVAPFVETVGDAVETATAVLEALREAGFDVYRARRHEAALLRSPAELGSSDVDSVEVPDGAPDVAGPGRR